MLTWQMPSAADEVSWPYEGFAAPERIWQVQPGDATVIAQGDAYPYLLVKPYGKGCFIYDRRHAAFDRTWGLRAGHVCLWDFPEIH